jgi:O-antigen/teichoic acid export membrane protein
VQYSAAGILKSIFSLSLANVLVQVIALLATIVVARSLGRVGYGCYATIGVYVGLFVVFSDLGISVFLTREGARGKGSFGETLGGALGASLVICLVVYAALVEILPHTGYGPLVQRLIIVFGIGLFFLQLQKITYAILQIQQKQKLQAVTEVFLATIRLLLYLAAFALGLGLPGIVVSNLSATVVAVSVIGGWTLWKCQRPEFSVRVLPAVFKGSYLFGLSALLTFAYFRSDTLMLSFLRSPVEVGLYSAAYNVVILGNEIPIIVMNYVLLPLMFAVGLANRTELLKFYKLSARYLLMLGLPMSVACLLLSKQVISFLYGAQFIAAAPALAILAFALVVRFMSSSAGAVLTSLDKMRAKVKIQACVALANILLNLLFIPRFGFLAAAMTTLLSEAALMTLYCLCTGKYLQGISIRRDLRMPPILASCLLMGMFLYLTRESVFFPGLVVGGALVYFLGLYSFGFVSANDRQIMGSWIAERSALLRAARIWD